MPQYRITLEGIRVDNQTWDHVGEVDGKGDEIYVNVYSQVVESPDIKHNPNWQVTKVMGDINQQPGRELAGTASDHGGIKTGDYVPYPEPWIRKADLSGERFPLVMYEGELRPDKAITLLISIWEFDGGEDMFNAWRNHISEHAGNVAQIAIDLIALVKDVPPTLGDMVKDAIDNYLPKIYAAAAPVLGHAENRPIGMKKDGDGYSFGPLSLTFNSIAADSFIGQNYGFGNGVGTWPFDDAPVLAGRYFIWYRVEKLSGPFDENLYKNWAWRIYVELLRGGDLSRPPSQGEVDEVVNRIQREIYQGSQIEAILNSIVKEFQESFEYCMGVAWWLYHHFLDRDPENDTAREELARTFMNGRPIQNGILGMCDSDEFKAKHPPPHDFVAALYDKILERPLDTGGFEQKVVGMINGVSTTDTITPFLIGDGGDEYARERVRKYYERYLRRAPDDDLALHYKELIKGGADIREIERAIVTRPDYINRPS